MNQRPKQAGAGYAVRMLVLAVVMVLMAGCGAATVRHVPKPGVVATTKMADLRGTPPLDVKAGVCSSDETSFGSVGVGKVVGKPSEWTAAAVEAIKANLVSRGATLTAGAPKALTITMTKAEVKAVPMVGVSKGRIVLSATTPDGLNQAFEGADSSMAPLSAVNGAMKDATTKLLMDPAVNAYMRKP